VVGSLAGAAVLTVGSLLWNGNTQLTRQGAQLDNLSNRITALEGVITSGTQLRYTSADAARDREVLTTLCTSNFKLITDAMAAEKASTVSTFAAIAEIRTRMEERIRSLEIWKATVEGSHK
jgi:hypothetical protein